MSVSHPSTVSTINKTGDKLVFPGNTATAAADHLCPLCQMSARFVSLPACVHLYVRADCQACRTLCSGLEIPHGTDVPREQDTETYDRCQPRRGRRGTAVVPCFGTPSLLCLSDNHDDADFYAKARIHSSGDAIMGRKYRTAQGWGRGDAGSYRIIPFDRGGSVMIRCTRISAEY